jgi:hypothetical protein
MRMAWSYGSSVRVLLILMTALCVNAVNAQWTFQAGYSYLFNRNLDDVFQAFNTARWWSDNPLKPLTNGADVTAGYNVLLHKKRQLHVVPQLSYGYSFTSTKREEVRWSAGIHRASINAQFRFHPRAIIKGVHQTGPLGPRWFMTIEPGYTFVIPFIRTAGEALMDGEEKDKPYRPLSMTFYSSLGIGHHVMMLKDRVILTPELSCSWYPYMELKDYSSNLNGHNILNHSDTFENVFFFQLRLRATFIKKEVKWWERPAADK